MVDLAALKALCKPERIAITEHARLRLVERGITVSDIISCIASGEIIEQYEDDKPFPSCLILGHSAKNKPIHAVVSEDGEFIYLITAYFPNENVWESDFRTRKERSI